MDTLEPILTIIQFVIIACPSNINIRECKFLIDSEEKEFSDDKSIQLSIKYPKSLIYYCSNIQIKHNAKIICSFDYLIYIGKKNLVHIDLEEKGKPSFELLFNSKDIKFNPASVQYKNESYNQLETYGNKYRSRIYFANVDPEKLEYVNSKKMKEYKIEFSGYNTYQTIFHISDHNKFEISATNMNIYYEDFYLDKKELSLIELNNLRSTLEQFCGKFKNYLSIDSNLLKARKCGLSELEDINKEIANNDLYDLINKPQTYKYKKCENFIKYKEYKIYEEKVLSIFRFNFFMDLFDGLIESNKINSEYAKYNISDFNKMEEILYNKILGDKNLNIEQKIDVLRTINLFFKESLIANKEVLNIDYINIKTISEKSPYFKAKEMLTKIINEMTEESRLFEAFLYFDCQVINNILLKSTQESYEYFDKCGSKIKVDKTEFITEYGMSLMTLGEVKQHLLDLLPTIIIRVDSSKAFRAMFQRKTKLMIINELQLFGHSIINNEQRFKNNPDIHVVPISMEILHEIFGHGKLRYNYEVESSPLAFRDSKYDFKIQKIMRKVKLDFNGSKEITVNKGETGRVLEHFISENPNFIEKLKEITENKDIIKSEYWTGKDFNSLYKAMGFNECGNCGYKDEIFLKDDESEDNSNCLP